MCYVLDGYVLKLYYKQCVIWTWNEYTLQIEKQTSDSGTTTTARPDLKESTSTRLETGKKYIPLYLYLSYNK